MSTSINTHKPKNQFASLPDADRKLVLDLCSEHTYDEAVLLLRKPRHEGGLNIITSRSALSRFYTGAHPEAHHALLAQIAAAMNIRHEQDANAFLGAIRATIQGRVLENLRSGRALADMQNDFKLLRTAETLYLADANFRALHPETARASYKEHVRRSAEAPSADFLPADESPATSNDCNDSNPPALDNLSQLERDILKERERLQEFDDILKSSRAQPEDPNLRQNQTLATLASALAARRARTAATPFPAANPAKIPVIPHFPPNPTNDTVPPSPVSSNPPETQRPKPTPHIAPAKIGRNDPCPCGSGRKSKKCCHR